MLDNFDYLNIDFISIIDVILVCILLYYVYKLVKGTAAINILIGIILIYIIWKLTDILNMNIFSNLLGQFISVGVFALIVVFQQEIRKFLLMLGSNNLTNNKIYFKYLKIFKPSREISQMNIDEFLKSCQKLSKKLSKNGLSKIRGQKNAQKVVNKWPKKFFLAAREP